MRTVYEMRKLYEEAQRCGETYDGKCKAIYSTYPDFRDMWMQYWGLNRVKWEKFYLGNNGKDEYSLCQSQYNYWLEGMRNLYFMDYEMDVDLQKIKFVKLEGEFNVGPGPEKNLDNIEIECACDFFWCIGASDYFRKYPYRTDVTAEMLFEFFRECHENASEEDTEEEKDEEPSVQQIIEPSAKKRRNEALWKAYRERHPLTKMSDLI